MEYRVVYDIDLGWYIGLFEDVVITLTSKPTDIEDLRYYVE